MIFLNYLIFLYLLSCLENIMGIVLLRILWVLELQEFQVSLEFHLFLFHLWVPMLQEDLGYPPMHPLELLGHHDSLFLL